MRRLARWMAGPRKLRVPVKLESQGLIPTFHSMVRNNVLDIVIITIALINHSNRNGNQHNHEIIIKMPSAYHRNIPVVPFVTETCLNCARGCLCRRHSGHLSGHFQRISSRWSLAGYPGSLIRENLNLDFGVGVVKEDKTNVQTISRPFYTGLYVNIYCFIHLYVKCISRQFCASFVNIHIYVDVSIVLYTLINLFYSFLYYYMTGWWYTYPSEKYDFVSWGYYSQLNGKS